MASVDVSSFLLTKALEPTPSTYLALSLLPFRLLYTFLIAENPLFWEYTVGKKNDRADVEGPFYLAGSPEVNIAPGKAMLASLKDLKESQPLLFVIRIRGPDGNPAANVQLDWWQADTAGYYHFRKHRLRGKFTTDDQGYAELLTVPPGEYSIPGAGPRPGHGHVIISPPMERSREWDALTTQLYVSEGNKPDRLLADPIAVQRKSREDNIMKCWSVPTAQGSGAFMNFPVLESDNTDLLKRTAWWDEILSGLGSLKVAAVTQTEISLNKKKGWF